MQTVSRLSAGGGDLAERGQDTRCCPTQARRAKLAERQSAKYTEKYADYLHLGVSNGARRMTSIEKLDKKAILFVMTDDTSNCDDVAEYLEAPIRT